MVNVPTQERVALVNQAPVSTTDVELAVNELKQFMQAYQQAWEPLGSEEKPEALDLHDVMNNVVDAELKAQDVKARGADQKTDVKQRLAYLLRSFYSQEWDRLQRDAAVPSEADIHQFYEQNKAAFLDPERISVRQIVCKTLAEAEAARSRAIQGEPFPSLARELSVGAGKEQGGDIGWHLRTLDKERLTMMGANPPEASFFPQLEPVAFALEKGQVSQPVKGPDNQLYVIELVDRKPAKQQSELDVHDPIKDLLTVQNMQQSLDQLRGKANIERFPERLDAVKQ
jgi:parvulin-like peptidyl-prolyl isomerase